MCDRLTVNPFGAQVGFIDFVVLPLFNALLIPFPNMDKIINIMLENKEECKRVKDQQAKLLEELKK